MNDLETRVRRELEQRSVSGGKLVEQLQAAGAPELEGKSPLVVYGALANLAARGEAAVVAAGPGERVWGAPGATSGRAAAPGFPPSFAMSANDLALAEKEVWERTRGVPGFYFEELRRVVVADADRRVFHGAKLPAAVTEAAGALGDPRATRRYLAAVEKGGPVPLALPRVRRRRGLVALLGFLALLVLLRLFVVGVYTVPAESISMAPALFPANEGGDAWVLVDLLSDRFSNPGRGEVWIFRRPRQPGTIVKRVMGLPGERLAIRGGDLFVDGRRLVKERPFLDRVKVPLFSRGDFAETPEGLLMPDWLRTQFRAPSGELEPRYRRGAPLGRAAPCRDIVARARVRLGGRGGTVTFLLETEHEEREPVATVVAGAARTTVALRGRLVERPLPGLPAGRAVEVWFTNADRTFRLEIAGEEVLRAPAPDAATIRLRAVVQDATLETLEVARDLVHDVAAADRTWHLGPHRYFVLGDNTAKSTDSRHYGPVHRADLYGRVWGVAWPPGRMRRVR